MSTDLQVVCTTHDPHISSDDVGNAHRDIIQVREDIANRKKLVEAYDLMEGCDFLSQGRRHLMWFLSRHRGCDLQIVDEYGKEYPLVDEGVNEDRNRYFLYHLDLDNLSEISELTGFEKSALTKYYYDARARGKPCLVKTTAYTTITEGAF